MKVSEIKPSSEELRVMLETGFILREAARFDEALAVFQGCIELMPNSEVPRVGLGTVYLQKQDFGQALNVCKDALDLNPESNYARVHYAEALLFQDRRKEAEIELQKVIADSPNSAYTRTAENLLSAANLIITQ